MKNPEQSSKSSKSTQKKNSQHNTKVKPPTKKQARREMDAELTLLSNYHWPIPKERVLKMAEDLKLMLSENPNMLTIISWREKHDIAREQIAKWCKEYPDFEVIYREVLDRLAWRKYERALMKELDANMTRFGLPLYSKEFKDMEEWRVLLKTRIAEAQKPSIQVVEIPTFKPSGVVPPKEAPPTTDEEAI